MIGCPACHSPSSVDETRSVHSYVRRRRRCDNVACGRRFTTVEVLRRNDKLAVIDPTIVSRRELERIRDLLSCILGEGNAHGSALDLEPISNDDDQPPTRQGDDE